MHYKKLPTNPKHKVNFDCVKIMTILSTQEDYLNKFDEALNSTELSLITMKKEKAPRDIIGKLEKELKENDKKRDILVQRFTEQVTKGRKMFYNEVDIK